MSTASDRKTLHDLLIEFARLHHNITAIYKGYDPEEGFSVYYFSTPHVLERMSGDDLSNLSLDIFRNHNFSGDVSYWPDERHAAYYRSLEQHLDGREHMSLPPDPVHHEDYGFLGECIWDREPELF